MPEMSGPPADPGGQPHTEAVAAEAHPTTVADPSTAGQVRSMSESQVCAGAYEGMHAFGLGEQGSGHG